MVKRGEIKVKRVSLIGRLFGCAHNWAFPQTSPHLRRHSGYPEGFDSHQTCTECGSKRLYDFKNFRPGPFIQETLSLPYTRKNV